MLVGGNLGFFCSVVVVVVGWLFARRKWRRAAARREEIRRLMALASEEAARAELEAAATYRIYGSSVAPLPVTVEPGPPPGRQFQHQCEVCFRQTTTRCKQCKAVHYCSRKCQILHWRQGHKDKCHSSIATQNRNVEQDGVSRNAIRIEDIHTTRPVESSTKTCIVSNPKFCELGENMDIETEVSDNREITDLNLEASVNSPLPDETVKPLPDECSSSTISIEMSIASDGNIKDYGRCNGQSVSMDVESTTPSISELPSLTNHEFGHAASSVSNQVRLGQIDADEKSKSSVLSGCSATGSEEYSPSVSCTPSSDLWAGMVEQMRSTINSLDETDDFGMSKSRSSCLPSSSNIHEIFGSGMNKVMPDDPCSATSIPKKSIALSEVNEVYVNSKEPLSFSGKLPGQCGDRNTSAKCNPTDKAKLSSFDTCHEGTYERHVRSTPVDISSLQSSAAKKFDNIINGTNGILDTLKCQQNGSSRLSSTESHLSSSSFTREPAEQVLESVESERTHDNASCSSDRSSHVRSAISGANSSRRRIIDQPRASNFVRHGSLGAGSGIMRRYEGSFPYELFVKLYNWNKVELSPCGLINCGNSCYANVVLQCLAFTPPLAAYCLQGLHGKTCKRKEWCFTCEFEELVEKAQEGNNALSPARIMSQMQHLGSHLGNGREEDAHEFLRYAIDAMQSVCLKETEVKVPSSLVEETTLLGLTFGGYLQSKIKCMRCGIKSKQHERIMDLTVEIEGEIGSLDDALLQFTRSEILDGENKYNCGRCKSYEKAKKKLSVLEAPNVLVIALKRFQTGEFGKLNKAIKFQEILNLAPYMSGTSDKSPIYQLYGVVVHLDVMNAVFSGHYVCYIKNNQGRWFKADDSVVQVVELEKVLSNDAYILLYARCSPRAPKVIRCSLGPRDPRNAKKPTYKVKSHLAEPWDVSVDGSSGRASNDHFSRIYRTYHLASTNVEEESLSGCSSPYFSEAGSHSTESSNRDSVSISDDSFDQMLSDTGNSWNRPWRRTSDSATPPPTRYSLITDLDRCSSDADSSSSCSVNISPKTDGDSPWERASVKEEVLTSKMSTFLCSSDRECSRIGGSRSSANETGN